MYAEVGGGGATPSPTRSLTYGQTRSQKAFRPEGAPYLARAVPSSGTEMISGSASLQTSFPRSHLAGTPR